MADELYSAKESLEDGISHIGKGHVGSTSHSGRYPWGSGEKWDGKNPEESRPDILGQVAKLKASGIVKSTDIAKALNMSTTEYRARYSVAYNAAKGSNISSANKLHNQGWSNVAISKEMGVPESTVRGWLKPAATARMDIASQIAGKLEASIPENGAIGVGKGAELYMGTSSDKLKVATQMLVDKGYSVKYMYINQLGTKPGQKTTLKVLCAPGVDIKGEEGLYQHLDRIKSIAKNIDNVDENESVASREPVSIDSKRVGIVYADQEWNGAKGVERDGVAILNPEAVDLRLPPNKHYAQVRIAVDGDHYIKGMAMYGDPSKFPKGVDVMFNTNKHSDVSKLDVLKKMEIDKQTGEVDKDNPFKAAIKPDQHNYVDPKTGKLKQSAINIVNEEGDWDKWSKSLASQMLSKQDPKLAERQLGISLDRERLEYDDISRLTNPVVRAKLLKDFSDGCDSASVDLKAAAMPGQKTHAILPINSLTDKEIYAPNYADGTRVVLVRYPHGGTFESPELVVNNRNREGRSYIGTNSPDAVGINAKVAEQLSGADFDGDNVLVIPNNHGDIHTSSPLPGLKTFDPKELYSLPKDIKPDDPRLISSKEKQNQMGRVSNLITDMTIKHAPLQDIERAVKHSMVVIDSEKHKLDYKQSYKDNGIDQLKRKWQGEASNGQPAGASTLISRASASKRVPEVRLRKASEGGYIDPSTGKKVWIKTNATYNVVNRRTDKNGNLVTKVVTKPRLSTFTKLSLVDDANELSSGSLMEKVYANYSNSMKALANDARKQMVSIQPFKTDVAAKNKYSSEVSHLVAQVNEAKKNAPLERKAQVIANQRVKSIRQAHPEYDKEDMKKISNRELRRARAIMGIKRHPVDISDKEWEAIQAHAVSANRLNDVLNYADPDRVRELATPKKEVALPSWSISRARSLMNDGLTNQEIADALGISVSTLSHNINK